jgi:uncharacterized protein YodC (DUF2158 family)
MKIIARGEDFQNRREPELRIGDIVKLNSGGPRMLIVDLPDKEYPFYTAAWKNGLGKIYETPFPRMCLHRVRNSW